MNTVAFRFTSLSVLVLAASAMLTGCAAPQTDDVYTADELRPGVGSIARDEVTFPVQEGTMVPDANGVATPLTRTMQGIRITFQDMVVEGSCDSDGTGEFYYEMDLNGRAIARRTSDSYYSAEEGQTVPVTASRVFFVEPDEAFSLRLSVSEKDDFLNGGDDVVGVRGVGHLATDLVHGSLWETVPLGRGTCAVDVTYALDRVQ